MGEPEKWRMVAWAAVVLVIAWAGLRMLRPEAPPPAPVRVQSESAGAGKARADGLFVHVAGSVRRPGLLRLESGARVAAAISRAGGPTRRADLTGVNLAQPLEDGQQVIVPARGAAARAGAGPGASTAAAGGATPAAGGATPSLATATLEQLDGLDGIGPTLAKRIVDYREAHGGFRSIDELREVEGIGEKRFATLRKLLRP